MLKMKYIGSKKEYDVEFASVTKNIVQLIGDMPEKTNGFTLSRADKNDNWDYSAYTTIYKKVDGGIQYSNDGSVYVEKPKIVKFVAGNGGSIDGATEQEVPDYEEVIVPTPTPDENYEFVKWEPEIPVSGVINESRTFTAVFEYVPTLEEVKESKIMEMNDVQQAVIQGGVDVRLTDGTVEHFTLTEHYQTSLIGLQTKVVAGEESIPWHTSDHADHCKYYSNADIAIITETALNYVAYHVTYFRDLRIYINALKTKEEVEDIFYGTTIPNEYRSEPLKDMVAVINA